jgi:hypothetical protein
VQQAQRAPDPPYRGVCSRLRRAAGFVVGVLRHPFFWFEQFRLLTHLLGADPELGRRIGQPLIANLLTQQILAGRALREIPRADDGRPWVAVTRILRSLQTNVWNHPRSRPPPSCPALDLMIRTSACVNLRFAAAVARTAYAGSARPGKETLQEIQRGRANLPVSPNRSGKSTRVRLGRSLALAA